MKILCILTLACLALIAVEAKGKKGRTCVGKKFGMLDQFNTRGIGVRIPCKYPAVRRQKCGKYYITVTPSNIWMGDNYYLDGLWFSVNDTETNEEWEARTSNKLIVKFYNSNGERSMFSAGDGGEKSKFTSDRFKTGLLRNKKGKIPGGYIEDNEKTFKLTFEAWVPNERKKYPHSSWTFECYDPTMEAREYPEQICGGDNLKLEEYAKLFGVRSNHMNVMVYHSIFSSDIVQMDEECSEATEIFKNCGNDTQKVLALQNCAEILSKEQHLDCTTFFKCSPMEAFNACMRWGCADTPFNPQESGLCVKVAESIDLCGIIKGAGNLTERTKGAECYDEFIEFDPNAFKSASALVD